MPITWSDGRLSLREVIDLYGQTGKFDVLAITDHILGKKDLLGRLGRMATLGRRQFSITPENFEDYIADIEKEAARAKREYGMLVIPGAEVTQNHIRAKHNSHIVALGIRKFISADEKAKNILEEIRRQDAVRIACHPHHRTTRRMEIGTCFLWDHRKELADLVDVWEAANRDDLFSVTSLKHSCRTSMIPVLVIINPVSGPLRRGRPAQRIQAAKRAFDQLGVPAEIRLSERVGHAHELALEGAASGVDLVIAWGGDGTINEVGRALVQTASVGRNSVGRDFSRASPALGIIPGGSGNGLARELRIPFDPAQAIERAVRAQPRYLDAGELGGRIFFNVAGIGFDAHVAALVSTRVKHRGLLPYVKAAFGDLVRYAPIDYSVTIDGKTFETSALFLAVANSKQYGFGAEIAPAAKLDDGLLDFVIVQDREFAGNVARIPSMFRGRLDQQKGVLTHRVREVTIRSRDSMLFHVDGEAVQGSDTLVARVHPGTLRLKA